MIPREPLRNMLRHTIEAFGPSVRVQLSPYVLGASPCSRCVELSKAPVLAAEAPLPPFEECTDPGKCVAVYSVVGL